MMAGAPLWPQAVSQHARSVDLLIASFGAMVWLLTIPVFLLMGWFLLRYRRGRTVNREHSPQSNVWIEASWSLIPFVLTLVFYAWATRLFLDIQSPPPEATAVNLVAKQWMWKFEHQSGAREINELHVPAGRPVRLVMTSQDVIHSLYVPALRIKQDVVPGRYTSLWFTADRPGRYPLRCAEFCGTDHSVMGGVLIVMRPSDFTTWLAQHRGGGADATLAARGARLFRQLGCGGCHAARSAVHAPSLGGLYGKPVPLSDGTMRVADAQYLRDAIMLPNKEVAAGYRPIMPSYGNLLDASEVGALVAYLQGRTEEDAP